MLTTYEQKVIAIRTAIPHVCDVRELIKSRPFLDCVYAVEAWLTANTRDTQKIVDSAFNAAQNFSGQDCEQCAEVAAMELIRATKSDSQPEIFHHSMEAIYAAQLATCDAKATDHSDALRADIKTYFLELIRSYDHD